MRLEVVAKGVILFVLLLALGTPIVLQPMGVEAQKPRSVVAAVDGVPQTLDPRQVTAQSSIWRFFWNIFEPLVGRGSIIPSLATRWEVSPDGRQWTFTLRQDVVFQNDEPLTADTVVEAIQALQRTVPSTTLSDALRDWTVTRVVTRNGDLGVEIRTAVPTSSALEILGAVPILPRSESKLVQEGKAPHLYGSGPFSLAAFIPGEELTLARYDRYRQRPIIERVRIRNVRDQGGAVQLAMNGEVQLAGPISPQQLGIVGGARVRVYRQSLPVLVYFQIAVGKSPWQDRRVRLALNYSIDRQRVIQVRDGFGQPASWISPPGTSAYGKGQVYSFNPALARQLLVEAGFPNGLDLALLADQSIATSVADVLRSDLGRSGFRPRVIRGPISMAAAATPDAILRSTSDLLLDPQSTALRIFQPFNLASLYAYKGPALDMLRQNGTEVIVAKVKEELFSDPPIAPIYWVAVPWLASPDLNNVEAALRYDGAVLFAKFR